MDMEQRKSGLVVPKPPPEPPPRRRYGPTEIQEPAARDMAKQALRILWDALDLSNPGGINLPLAGDHDQNYRLYRFVGETLLGDDWPEKEVLT